MAREDMTKVNSSPGGFESKEAPDRLKGPSSDDSKFSTGLEPGAGEVGQCEGNPYGPDYQKK